MAYVEYNSPNPGKGLRMIGELRLHQKEPLLYRGLDFRFKQSLLVSQEFTIEDMMESIMRRNCETYNNRITKYTFLLSFELCFHLI